MISWVVPISLDLSGILEKRTLWLRSFRFRFLLGPRVRWSRLCRFICICTILTDSSTRLACSFRLSLAFPRSSVRFVISRLHSIGPSLLTPFGAETSLHMNNPLKSYLLTVCAVSFSGCIDLL